jgi:hypothetical protein
VLRLLSLSEMKGMAEKLVDQQKDLGNLTRRNLAWLADQESLRNASCEYTTLTLRVEDLERELQIMLAST